MNKFMFLWLFSFLLTSNLQAVWNTGNNLVGDMREYDKWENGNRDVDFYKSASFSSYISGVADTMIDASYICIPEGVNSGQVFGIVKKYIKNNPEKWNIPASHLVIQPLLDAFPCKQEKK
ncbi:MAG: Rap1a/Tai family immunity protein [Sulfurimonas sp.]|uniref:Rap1a/Tai family immunity protein n=1 Tax=Sulfurimonas sp. TaxID=2022749 RepID=UPI002609B1AA|nr:Rap1a/Tai family immunity protein [Sulfurimonas sp.]MDD5371874.1 Rap1a/Tai family immunity protein [Sulfurimonas sp.]